MASALPQIADGPWSLSHALASCPAPQHSGWVLLLVLPFPTLHLWLGCRTVTSFTLLQHTAAGPEFSIIPGQAPGSKARLARYSSSIVC
jgi:hypothetical protein